MPGRFEINVSTQRRAMRSAVAGLVAVCVLLTSAASQPVLAGPARYAAFVVDANTGEVLHADAADAERFPASLTKMMTLYVMFEMLQKKRMTLNTPLQVSAYAAAAQPSKLGLRPGETITVRDAMRAIVTKSANDAAATIAENLGGSEAKFAKYMTWRAKKLGMTRTVFRNASGLPHPEQHSTARDFVTLALRLNDDFPQYWSLFKTQYFVYKGRRFRNHNSLLFNFQGTDGLKTGYTRASGFNLVSSVRRNGKHVIGAVFGGRTGNERNARMRSLLRAGLDRASPVKTRRSGGEAMAANSPAKVKKSKTLAVATATREAVDVPAPQAVPATKRTGLTAFLKKKTLGGGRTASADTAFIGSGAPDEPPVSAVKPKAKPTKLKLMAAVQPAAAAEDEFPVPAKTAAPDAGETSLNEPSAPGPFHIQLGAYDSQDAALARLAHVKHSLAEAGTGGLVKGHAGVAVRYDTPDKVWYRARFAAYDKAKAQSVCQTMKQRKIDCLVMKAQ